jgi:hypothetical protein
MSVTLLLDGLDELRKALRDMPDALTNDALAIVATAAEDTATAVKAVYPNTVMDEGVFVVDRSQQYQAKFVVESRTSMAIWWEYGTANRTTQLGWNRGAEPAHPDQGLISIAKRNRARMTAALIALVQDAGFDVHESLA